MAKGRRSISAAAETKAYDDFLQFGRVKPPLLQPYAAQVGLSVGQLQKWWSCFERHQMPTLRMRNAMAAWLVAQAKLAGVRVDERDSSAWAKELEAKLMAGPGSALPPTESRWYEHRVKSAIKCLDLGVLASGLTRARNPV